jgi:DNA polymerase III subunit epsilon
MDFVAIDVETANPDMSSICQIGLALFQDGEFQRGWKSYVDPRTWFSPFNVRIHGIDENKVSGAPTLRDVEEPLRSYLEGNVVVCHTQFDRVAMHQAFGVLALPPLTCRWVDSARVARRTWSQFSQCGYGLSSLCDFLGYEFQHHDALEDAKAAGHVLLAAIETSSLSLEEWLAGVASYSSPRHARDGDPDGPLIGEVVVFTGALMIPRREAAELASAAGCQVADNVSNKTTLLVVGDQDVTKLAGHDKSSKHRKAESLMADGHSIRILRESDFAELVGMPD